MRFGSVFGWIMTFINVTARLRPPPQPDRYARTSQFGQVRPFGLASKIAKSSAAAARVALARACTVGRAAR